MVTGFRRGENFVPKTYSKHEYDHPFDLITGIDEDTGVLMLKGERAEG
jgi:hypothetical protein